MAAIRVVVADDDASFRGAVVDLLTDDPRFSVVGTAASGDEAVQLAGTLAPDVVLVDLRMPSGGAEAVHALTGTRTRNRTSPAVVAVSSQVATGSVLAMLRAGAVGFLGKGRLGADLPDLVARAAAGEVVLAVPSATEILRRLLHPSGTGPVTPPLPRRVDG